MLCPMLSKPTRTHLPAQIWVLGFVSMLMDISSEMIHSLLPLFMAGTLGMSVWAIGLIEGLAERFGIAIAVSHAYAKSDEHDHDRFDIRISGPLADVA